MFHNAREYWMLYPDAVPELAQYCAPRVEDGNEVERVRQQIALRSALAGRQEESRIDPVRGYIDLVRTDCIAGWAQNPVHPEAPVCLDIYAGGQLIGQTLANRYRQDLARAGLGSGCHSFEFKLRKGLQFASQAVEVRRSLDGTNLRMTKTCAAVIGTATYDQMIKGDMAQKSDSRPVRESLSRCVSVTTDIDQYAPMQGGASIPV